MDFHRNEEETRKGKNFSIVGQVELVCYRTHKKRANMSFYWPFLGHLHHKFLKVNIDTNGRNSHNFLYHLNTRARTHAHTYHHHHHR